MCGMQHFTFIYYKLTLGTTKFNHIKPLNHIGQFVDDLTLSRHDPIE